MRVVIGLMNLLVVAFLSLVAPDAGSQPELPAAQPGEAPVPGLMKGSIVVTDGRQAPGHSFRSGAEVNTRAFIGLRFAPAGYDSLKTRHDDYVIVADLQRNGETTWNRIHEIEPLSRRVKRASGYLPGHPELLQSGPLPVLYVNDSAIDLPGFIHEDDPLVWLPTDPRISHGIYDQVLGQYQARGRNLLMLNLHDLVLFSSGASPQRYSAGDGDRLRITVLRTGTAPVREFDRATYDSLPDSIAEFLPVLQRAYAQLTDDQRRSGLPLDMGLKAVPDGADAAARQQFKAGESGLSPRQRGLINKMLQNGLDGTVLRVSDIVTVQEDMTLLTRDFGIKLDVSPVVAYGRFEGRGGNVDGFNPIKTNPSVGSNVYLVYDGSTSWKRALNVLPGAHLSLLGLGGGAEAKFTLAVVHPILPGLRHYFGLFFGWHDLKRRVWGLTFSPNINFRGMVRRDGTPTPGADSPAPAGDGH